MKTNLLQSQLCRNALVITLLTKQFCESKADAKAAMLEQSRRHHRAKVRNLRKQIIKLAAIQKGIKFDLLATKMARLVVRKKHGTEDQRYTDWKAKQSTKSEGIGIACTC